MRWNLFYIETDHFVLPSKHHIRRESKDVRAACSNANTPHKRTFFQEY